MKAQATDRTERRGIGIATERFESLGFAFREQSESDYGIDAHAELIESEQPTGRLLGIQLKSGPSYFSEQDKTGLVFRTDEKHVNYWCEHALPVLICLCDVETRTIYWQVVNRETAMSTGKGYKIIIPSTQLIESSSVESLRKLLTPIVPATRYTIFETNDISHGAAKRYSFSVVINGSATKLEIAAIVRQVTKDGIKSRYYRNQLVKNRYGNSDAQVVCTFVYPTADDFHRRTTFICRTIWIDDKLDKRFRPLGFQGENIGNDIIVKWNDNYHEWAKDFSEHTGSKEEYLLAMLPLSEELEVRFLGIEGLLDKYNSKNITEEEFIAASEGDLKRIDELFRKSGTLGFYPPVECCDVNQKFQSFVCSLHAISVLYEEKFRKNQSKENKLKQAVKQCSYARDDLQHFKYELSKIR